MASSIGSLVVKLGLDAAEFTTGLQKSEREAKQFARNLEAGIATAARVLGASLVVAGAAAVAMSKDIIADAAALDDLSDATGSSVENLSRLANQAKISGTSFETLQGLVLKLSAGMAGADDESSNVGRALKFLGVEAKDPAEALQQVALALGRYSDGIGKAAIARDLFGKGGPAFLATLKDIAELQDVSATTTAKQAAEAEKLEKSWRRLGVEGTLLKNIILSDVVPAINNIIDRFKLAREAGEGFFASFIRAGTNTDQLDDTIARQEKQVERVRKAVEAANASVLRKVLPGNLFFSDDDLRAEEAKLRALHAIRLKALQATEPIRGGDKKPADYTGTKEKQAASGVDEFARALESADKAAAALKAELDALNSGEVKLLQSQRALAVLMADDVWRKFSEPERELIRLAFERGTAYEKEIEAIRRRREEYEKSLKALHDQAEAETKLRDAIRGKVADYAENNNIIKRQIAIMGQGQAAQDKLNAAIEYEKLLKEARAAKDLASIANLEKEYSVRLQLIDAIEQQNKVLDEQRKSKEFVDALAQSFASAAEEAIVFGRSAKDVLKGLEQDLLRIITRRLVTQPLEAALSSFFGGMGVGNIGAGGASSAGGFGSWLSSLFGGGTTSASWNAMSAATIPSFATGTNFAPGGWAKVHRDEIINLPRGAQVIPAERLVEKRDARVTNIVINNLPGATKQSAMQAADAMTRQQMRASRNG